MRASGESTAKHFPILVDFRSSFQMFLTEVWHEAFKSFLSDVFVEWCLTTPRHLSLK